MERKNLNFINELMYEKRIISEILDRLEKGEVLESVLWNILNRGGYRKIALIDDREGLVNLFIKKYMKIREFRLIIKLLATYNLSNFFIHLKTIRELMKLLERNAFNRHLDETIKKRLIVKTTLIASTLSVSTGIILSSMPKILMKLSEKYVKITAELINIYSISAAVIFALNTYIILEILTDKRNISKTIPIIIFAITLAVSILTS